MADTITVQVCYAVPQTRFLRDVVVPRGATLKQAVMASGVLAAFPELDLAQTVVGIFGKVKSLESVVGEQDRIELYRPLIADPKESRRRRAGGVRRRDV